jgi:hypothetical protein
MQFLQSPLVKHFAGDVRHVSLKRTRLRLQSQIGFVCDLPAKVPELGCHKDFFRFGTKHSPQRYAVVGEMLNMLSRSVSFAGPAIEGLVNPQFASGNNLAPLRDSTFCDADRTGGGCGGLEVRQDIGFTHVDNSTAC